MSNVVFYSTDMRWGGARGGVKVHDALARGRTTAGGRDYPVPGGMLETAENLRRQYGISRAEQDELAVASHQRAVAAQKDGILAEEIIPVTVRSRQRRRGDRHRRASARRHLGGIAEQAQTRSAASRIRTPPSRRATPAARTTPRRCASSPRRRRRPNSGLTPAGPAGVLGRRGSGARTSWASARCPRPRSALAQGRPDAGRHRPHRTQRGVRRAGAGGDARVEVHRDRPGAHQRARARASRSVIRSARPAAGCSPRWRASSNRRGGAVRPGDHVHRRRAGPGRGVREGGGA